MISLKRSLVTWILVLWACSCCLDARQCLGRDQCSCAFDDDQSLIALQSLANSDLTPRFSDISSADGSSYSYNPCYPFTEGDCAQAAVCEKTVTGITQNIGDSQTAQFQYKDGTLAVGYTSGSGFISSTQVILQCDQHACEPTIVADGKEGPKTYQLTLISVCACPNGCNETGPIQCTSTGSRLSNVFGIIPIMVFIHTLMSWKI